MGRKCALCGKTAQYGAVVSHAHNVSKKKRHPNLHRIWAKINGKKKRILVCSKCLRSGKIEKV